MAITKIGIKVPSDAEDTAVRTAHDSESGMTYEVYRTTDSDSYLVGACYLIGAHHEDVGQVLWYRADSFKEALNWVEEQGADISDLSDEDAQPCAYEVFAGNRIDQPAYCEDEAAPGSEYCEAHANAELEYEDRPEADYKYQMELSWERGD